MINYYKKYKNSKKVILALILIYILTVIFLMLNINLRNKEINLKEEKITEQVIEIINLKEIVDKKGEKQNAE